MGARRKTAVIAATVAGRPACGGFRASSIVRHCPGQQQRAGGAEHHLPPEAGRHHRADEDGQRLPDRPEAVDTERRALARRRGPAGDEGRAHREGRSGHADEERRHEQRA
jgi:hypothetical protein